MEPDDCSSYAALKPISTATVPLKDAQVHHSHEGVAPKEHLGMSFHRCG
jgi:hypothetical protein